MLSDFATYLVNLLVALDEMGNAMTGGDPRRTISYRAAVAAQAGDEWGKDVCALLDEIDPGHCADAIKNES